jgi:hypothetical protein
LLTGEVTPEALRKLTRDRAIENKGANQKREAEVEIKASAFKKAAKGKSS